ncbi:MAG TPA: lipase [Oxalobacteraceae bacterium]|jgi:pimeloyl-ACP methyl ester carboxylesterase|nr:lipase [Oxalobacteraceae bacterium]
MVARITRILILLQIIAVIALFILARNDWRVERLWLALAIGIGSVCLFRIFISANNFMIAWRYRSETPSAHRLGWRQTCQLFTAEFGATMWSSTWSMPFLRFSKRTTANPVGLPVLLIHGYGCNSGYWHSLSRFLARKNITHYAVDLEPVLGDIDGYSAIVEQAVEAVCRETGHDKIILVAHSMGGLVTRAYLRDHGSARIAKIITLGTPHHGTGLAKFGIGANSRQMRREGSTRENVPSDWLCQLEKSEDPATRALFVSIFSHHDNIISPQTSSYLPGARNIEFHGIGHVALALNPQIQAQVVEEIHNTEVVQQTVQTAGKIA